MFTSLKLKSYYIYVAKGHPLKIFNDLLETLKKKKKVTKELQIASLGRFRLVERNRQKGMKTERE